MNDIERALLIILSSFLALFLTLSIVAIYKFIQVIKSIQRIAEKAEHIADNAESLSDIFVKSSGPIAFGKLLSHIAESVFHKNSSKSKKEKK